MTQHSASESDDEEDGDEKDGGGWDEAAGK